MIATTHSRWKKTRPSGFTLLEVLLALGIFSLLIVGIVSFFIAGFKNKEIIFEQLSVQSEARKMAQDFVNELRSATVSSIGAYPLATAGTSTIVFYTNLDTDTYRERVRYFVDGTIIKKGIIKPDGNPLTYNPVSEIITESVHSVMATTTSLFTYYDQSYNGGATSTALNQPVNVSQVRVVGLTVTLEKNPLVSPAPLTVEAKTEIRNLKSN